MASFGEGLVGGGAGFAPGFCEDPARCVGRRIPCRVGGPALLQPYPQGEDARGSTDPASLRS
eukprot:9002227-Lingulodinium_polyedra.AAC.1